VGGVSVKTCIIGLCRSTLKKKNPYITHVKYNLLTSVSITTDSLIYDNSMTDSLIYDNSTTDSLIYDNSIKTSSFNSMSLSHVPFIFVLFVFLVNFSATTD